DTGVIHVSPGGHHGGFSLYVPEHYSADRAWPVIIALHGGSGNGRDFLWTWVREAKSFGYLLLAPTAVVDTWSEVDDEGLRDILSAAGAALQYRELPDLSHTYPRSENVCILRWFEALPPRASAA